jgi:C4-dicarboxylate-specific signal transduction histidine kinase
MNSVEILLDTTSTWIKGEKSKIQQCLVNICENAIEAMEKGGLRAV